MSAALELGRPRSPRGDEAVFVPTGQTGMLIDGRGVAVDRAISDFVQGTVERMLVEAEDRGDGSSSRAKARSIIRATRA